MSDNAKYRSAVGWCAKRLDQEYGGASTPCSVREAVYTDNNGVRRQATYRHWKKCSPCEATWCRQRHSELEVEISVQRRLAIEAGVQNHNVDAIIGEVEGVSVRSWDDFLASGDSSRYANLTSAQNQIVSGMHNNIHAYILDAQRENEKEKPQEGGQSKKDKGKKKKSHK